MIRRLAPLFILIVAGVAGLYLGMTFRTLREPPDESQPLLETDLLLGCAPCKDMSRDWQKRLENGELDGIHFFTLVDAPSDKIALYKSNNRYTFPVYADTAGIFAREHHIADYPLLLVVDRADSIRYLTWDPVEPIGMDRVRDMIAGS